MSRAITTCALCLITFIFILDSTVVNVALPYIAGDLSIPPSEGIYLITFFSIGSGIFLPLSGWIGRSYGKSRVIFFSIIGFTIFSLACSLSNSLISLVICRFLQGAFSAPLTPLSQSILNDIYDDKDISKITAIYAAVLLIAPIMGPLLSGIFCEHLTWRWVFYINVPFGIFTASVIYANLYGKDTNIHKSPIDWISVALIFSWIISLQLTLDKGDQWNWFESPYTKLSVMVSVISFFYLLIWSLSLKNPMFNFNMFLNPQFSSLIVILFLIYSFYVGSVVILPFWLQTSLGYTALWSGISVAPVGIPTLFLAPFVPKIMKKIGAKYLLINGFIWLMASSIYSMNFTSDVDIYHIVISRLIRGVGVAFWVTPIMQLPRYILSKDKLMDGLSIFHFIRAISGAIGSSLYITIFNRGIAHHHHNLVGELNARGINNIFYTNALSRLSNDQKLYFIDMEITKSAAILSFRDINILMAVISLGLIAITFIGIKRDYRSI